MKQIKDDDQYYTLPSGRVVNISETLRIFHEVNRKIRPGMTEADVDALIHETVKRLSPN